MIKYLKYLLEKIFFGFTDKELQTMDYTFYLWLYPRLIRIKQLTNTYPLEYNSLVEWLHELDRRIIQLEQLVVFDKKAFVNYYYLTKDAIDDLPKKYRKGIHTNILAYEECAKNFNEWFFKNLTNLNLHS